MPTPQYLLEGIFYALEQAGRCLRGARACVREHEYADAIILATAAWEELGHSGILRDLREGLVQRGEAVTVEHIRKRCENHVAKLAKGQLSVVQRGSTDEGLGKLIWKRMHAHPHSEEYKRLDEQLEDITKRQKKRTPNDRHELRTRAQYVGPDDFGTKWNRPCQVITEQTAKVCLDDAGNDYRIQYDLFQMGSVQHCDEELFRAIQAWQDRPELPAPPWP